MQEGSSAEKHLDMMGAKKLWIDEDHIHLTDRQIMTILIEKMDPAYLIERGAKDVIKALRQKYRRQAKLPTERQNWLNQQTENSESRISDSSSTMFTVIEGIIQDAKIEGKKEAWAEMDKWMIRHKPLRLVSFEEIREERNKDEVSASGMYANVRFYDSLLDKMKPGQTVSDAMDEGEVIAIRDVVFAKELQA